MASHASLSGNLRFHRRNPYDLYTGRMRPLPLRPCFYEDLGGMSMTLSAPVNTPRDDKSFRKAMKRLSKELEKAEEFYSTFKSEFDDEIKAVMKYCPKEVSNTVWHWKVEESGTTHAPSPDNNPDHYDDEMAYDEKNSFQDMNSSLSEALQAVVSASPQISTRVSPNRLARVKEKVESARTYIIDLANKTEENHEYLDDLLMEMGELKGVVKSFVERSRNEHQRAQVTRADSVGADQASGGTDRATEWASSSKEQW